MPTVINGSFTVQQALENTRKYFKTRMKNAKRDKVKVVKVKQVKYFKKDRKNMPLVKYIIETRSIPQYKPYFTGKDSRGRKRKSQRKVKHNYDLTFEIDQMTIYSPNWRLAVGSMRIWKKAPQNKVKTVRRKTMEQWKKQSLKMGKTKEEQRKWLDKKIKRHRSSAKYLDDGDYNSQVRGINGDFIFRFAFPYFIKGHLFGRNYYGNKKSSLNPKNIIAFPKHAIVLIKFLLQRNILTNNPYKLD